MQWFKRFAQRWKFIPCISSSLHMYHTCATGRAQDGYLFGGGRHLPDSSHHRWRGHTWQQRPTTGHAWSLSSAQSDSWGLSYRRWTSRSPTNRSPPGLSLESVLAVVHPSCGWWALSQTSLPATAGSLSPCAGSPHPAGTIVGQLLANPSAVRPRNASGCRRTAPCLLSACAHQRLKKRRVQYCRWRSSHTTQSPSG